MLIGELEKCFTRVDRWKCRKMEDFNENWHFFVSFLRQWFQKSLRILLMTKKEQFLTKNQLNRSKELKPAMNTKQIRISALKISNLNQKGDFHRISHNLWYSSLQCSFFPFSMPFKSFLIPKTNFSSYRLTNLIKTDQSIAKKLSHHNEIIT